MFVQFKFNGTFSDIVAMTFVSYSLYNNSESTLKILIFRLNCARVHICTVFIQ